LRFEGQVKRPWNVENIQDLLWWKSFCGFDVEDIRRDQKRFLLLKKSETP
jgi:hypothetical protein